MINKNKISTFVLFLLIIVIFNSVIVSADWYKGSTHQHTGFSTAKGYDHNLVTLNDMCPPTIEGNPFDFPTEGNTVSELKQNATALNLSWLAFTDHSYCLDQDEFQTVKTDCSNAQQAGTFACLNGEELSVSENVLDKEIITSLPPSLCGTLLGIFGEAHIQAVGINSYIAQTPFGAHCPLAPKAQKAIKDIKSKNGLAIIAHPDSVIGVEFLDFEGINKVRDEDGIEIWNHHFEPDDNETLGLWVHTRLLNGIRNSWAFAATDSHHDVDESPYQNVYLASLGEESLKEGLRSGRHVASNNGYLDISIDNAVMGSTTTRVSGNSITIYVDYDVDSSCTLELLGGSLGTKKEIQVGTTQSVQDPPGTVAFSDTPTANGYYRAECINEATGRRIYSNPVWVDIEKIITITNIGTGSAKITSIDENYAGKYANWIKLNESDVFNLAAGASKGMGLKIVKEKFGSQKEHTAVLTVRSTGGNKTVTVSVTNNNYLSASHSLDKATLTDEETYEANMPFEFGESENFRVTLDWDTKDSLLFYLVDPNGVMYKNTTSAANFSFSGDYPQVMEFNNMVEGEGV